MPRPGVATPEPAALARRLSLPAAAATAAAGAVVTLVLRDPHVAGSWGLCPALALTGLYCPGCGGLRAVNDLAHLRVVDAVSSNAWAVLLIVGVALAWAAWTWGRARGRPWRWENWVTAPVAWATLASMVAFSVLRNTPWFAFLAP